GCSGATRFDERRGAATPRAVSGTLARENLLAVGGSSARREKRQRVLDGPVVPLLRKARAAVLDDEHLVAAVQRCADHALDREGRRDAHDEELLAPELGEDRVEPRAVAAVHRAGAPHHEVRRLGLDGGGGLRAPGPPPEEGPPA